MSPLTKPVKYSVECPGSGLRIKLNVTEKGEISDNENRNNLIV